MSLFSILVDIRASTAQLVSEVQNAENSIGQFVSTIKGSVGALAEIFAVDQIAEYTEHVLALGDALETEATRAGVAGQAFTELAYAAKTTGVGSDTLSNAFVKMGQALSNAATGAKLPNEALQALGLSIKDLQGLNPEDQFEILAQRISTLGTQADKTRATMDLFGRSGAELLPLLSQGAQGIDALRQQAEALGAAMTDEQLKTLQDAHKAVGDLEDSFGSLGRTLVTDVAPHLQAIADTLTGLISGDQLIQLKAKIESLQLATSSGFDEGPAGAYNRAQLRQSQQDLGLQQLVLQPSQLHSPLVGDLFAGTAPGFLTTPDALQPFSVTAQKMSASNFGVNPAVQGYLDSTQGSLDQALSQLDKTKTELKGALDDGALSVQEYTTRVAAAVDVYNNKIDSGLEEFQVTARKLPQLIEPSAQALNDFVSDFDNSFMEATRQTGNFAQNFVKDMLNAFENRAMLAAIDALGARIKDSLKDSGFGGFLAQVFGLGSDSGPDLFSAAEQQDSVLDAIGSSPVLPLNLGTSATPHAGGGPATAGFPYMVGEQGKELFIPGQSGTVIPNNMLGGGAGINYAPVTNIGSGVSRAELLAAMDMTHKRAVATLSQMLRGGAFAGTT
jgi:hypothetical protein